MICFFNNHIIRCPYSVRRRRLLNITVLIYILRVNLEVWGTQNPSALKDLHFLTLHSEITENRLPLLLANSIINYTSDHPPYLL